MINPKKKTVILGDFNISFPDNLLSKELLAWEFKQLVEYLSHIEGNIIDHVYISNKVDRQLVVLDHHLVYYIDYDLFTLNLSCWSWVVFEICLKSVQCTFQNLVEFEILYFCFVADVDIVKLEVKVDFCWLLMDILP